MICWIILIKKVRDFISLYTLLHDELNIEFNLLPNQTSFQPKLIAHNKRLDLFYG